MKSYTYIIIGAGMTGDSAVKGIRSVDSDGSIAIFSKEPDKPYNRPPLSKALWKGGSFEDVWRKTPEEHLHFYLNTTIESIDTLAKTVTDAAGNTYHYKKLLFANGGSVRTLPFSVEGVIYYRTLEDYRNLREAADTKKTFAIIGGGFIGTEIAAGLTINKNTVTMIFPEGSIGERNYPKDLSNYITDYYKSKGVSVFAGDGVEDITKNGEEFILKTKSGKKLNVDGVVAGIGITVNTALAEKAGLPVENGIIVDEYCRTSDDSIFAAGDVANFFDPELGKRIRIEHEDNANKMGECAGKNMAGHQEAYQYLPYFYSDLFDLGYEGIGELDSRHEMVCDWKEENKEGVIYYLGSDRIRGVLLWNVWEKIDRARTLIASQGPYSKDNVKGLIAME